MSDCPATAEAVAECLEVDTGCPLCGKGPSSHRVVTAEDEAAFDQWLSDPVNRERWDRALADVLARPSN